jgi:phytoene dehydrogenase-like protein
MQSEYDVVVIGAGHNGLVAAAMLQRAGRSLLVVEQRDTVGGACVTEEVWPGYQVSTAAYLCSLLQPEIVADLELERHGFEVYRRETAGFAPYLDGRSLMLHADSALTRAELEAFCTDTPEDVDAYFAFEAEIERVAEIVEPFLSSPPPDTQALRAAFHAHGAEPLYTAFLEGSVAELLDARFHSDRLKAVLATDGLIGTYGGVDTPGTAYVLLHHYLGRILGARGAWGYVRGGMGRITQALAAAFTEAGGTIRTGAPVKRIVTGGEGLHITGVELSNGEVVTAPIVLCNADPYRMLSLLDMPEMMELVASSPIGRLRSQGGASAKINLAVTELPRFTCLPEREAGAGVGPEHLGTVHLCEGMEALRRAWDEAARGLPSTEPMVEVYLQTATDRSLTPPGRHILSLFVQYFPYNLAPGLDLDTERERFADRVIAIVGRYAPNVPGSILHRPVLTPRAREARFGLTGGHIFHGDLLPPNLWSTRPANGFHGAQTPISGLYLCGSGAHPGGCVCGTPGANAARAVLAAATS